MSRLDKFTKSSLQGQPQPIPELAHPGIGTLQPNTSFLSLSFCGPGKTKRTAEGWGAQIDLENSVFGLNGDGVNSTNGQRTPRVVMGQSPVSSDRSYFAQTHDFF